MVSYARATRGLRRPSLDTRSGNPFSLPSRVKVEERWSLDARREGQFACSLWRRKTIESPSWDALAGGTASPRLTF